MHNMQDELSGPMTLEFIGGTKTDAMIETVVVDTRGNPLLLMEEDGVIYNWGTVVRAVRR